MSNVVPLNTRPRLPLKLVHKFPAGEDVVGIVNFKDVIFIATTQAVYRMTRDDKLEKVLIADTVHGFCASTSDDDA